MKQTGVVILTIFLTLFMVACLGPNVKPKGDYNVVFVVDDGVYYTTKADVDNPLVFPDNPEKDGFQFKGWLLSGELITDEIEVNSHLTLIAYFEIVSDGIVTLTFVNGSSTYHIINGEAGDEFSLPDNPTGNRTFLYWTLDDGSKFEVNVLPNDDLTVYAKYAKQIMITFYNENAIYDTIFVEEGSVIVFPDNPTSTNSFIGWYSQTQVLYEEGSLAPDSHLNLYALYEGSITVSFYVDDVLFDSSVGIAGEPLFHPNNPTKEGYDFLHWATTDGNRFNSFIIPEEDLDLYAVFGEPITITFYVEGSLYNTLETYTNTPITYPDDPTFGDMYFRGWYTIDDVLFEEYETNESISLFAKFSNELPSHLKAIHFYQNNTLLHREIVEVGSKFDPKVVARKAGYNFKAWYLDPELLTLYDINSNVGSDITLHGDWYDLTTDLTGYYKNLPYGLTGNTLRNAIHNIIDLPFSQLPTYDDAKFSIPVLDKDPNNPNNVIQIYTGISVSNKWNHDLYWNREHIVPQSMLPQRASAGSKNSASDIHNLKPLNGVVNSERSNYAFTDGSGNNTVVGGTKYYPGDDWIGDVARTLLYMIVQYDLTQGNLIDSYDLALDWIQRDPVDAFEARRNNLVFSFQPNRNPFIDLPYLAYHIWATDKI